MTNNSIDKPKGTDCLATDEPPQKHWRLKCDNHSAARLALYAAQNQRKR